MQHIIKKQVIELQIQKSLDAFRIQQAVSDHYRQHLLPLLEKEFDALAGPDEMVFIDRMEIDLGELTESEIAGAAVNDYVINKITHQLAENVQSTGAGKLSSISKKALNLNSSVQWIFYMKNGVLPWNLLHTDEQWYQHVLEALATDYNSVEELRELIAENSHVVKRIAYQHPADFLVKLTEILTSEKQASLPQAIKEIQAFVLFVSAQQKSKAQPVQVSETLLWQDIIEIASVKKASGSLIRICEALLKKYTLSENITLQTNIDVIKPQLKMLLPVIVQMQKEAGNTSPKKNGERAEERSVKQDIISSNPITHPEFNSMKKKHVLIIDEEGVFVQHAGLVLTHPFLATLFNRLGLVSQKKFVSEQAREKAVFLLYYIVTGSTVAEEHELLVPKLLCGWLTEAPVAKEIQLSDQEKQEADDMLTAIIQQWSILKKTSSEGLRETFLKRPGKVFTKNETVHIQVESGPVDMLLDHLPWNLSIIKLPWIKDIIKVEWR